MSFRGTLEVEQPSDVFSQERVGRGEALLAYSVNVMRCWGLLIRGMSSRHDRKEQGGFGAKRPRNGPPRHGKHGTSDLELSPGDSAAALHLDLGAESRCLRSLGRVRRKPGDFGAGRCWEMDAILCEACWRQALKRHSILC